MGNLAIIPARGGSKRIPRKNIKDFLGKPIIAYSIEKAIESKLFTEVMVSTDDKEIAEVAIRFGATVPTLRSDKNANDTAVLSDVVREVINGYIKNGRTFDLACCILPTAPLLTVEHLKQGYAMMSDLTINSVRPVVRFSYPIQRAFRMNGNRVEMMYPEYRLMRSQDLEVAYHDAGQFYWMRYVGGLEEDQRAGFEIPELYCQDIDLPEDWLMAEIKYSAITTGRVSL